jgi:hypothetical protein
MTDKDVIEFVIFIPLLIIGIVVAFKDNEWKHTPPSEKTRRND